MGWVRCCGGKSESGPVDTTLPDLAGAYTGSTNKTSSILVPKIGSSQVLRITGTNGDTSMFFNWTLSVLFSLDGSTFSTIYTSANRPFPVGGAVTTLDVSLSNVAGQSGYFRISFTDDSRNTVTLSYVACITPA